MRSKRTEEQEIKREKAEQRERWNKGLECLSVVMVGDER